MYSGWEIGQHVGLGSFACIFSYTENLLNWITSVRVGKVPILK